MDRPDLAKEFQTGEGFIWTRRTRDETFQKGFIFTFIIALFILEANCLIAQEKFSLLGFLTG